MSAQSIPTNTKHVGYLVSEHARLVVPVASTYARRDQGEAVPVSMRKQRAAAANAPKAA